MRKSFVVAVVPLLSLLVTAVGARADGPTTRLQYDPNRNLIRQTDANDHVVSMEYDERNRLRFIRQDPEGANLATEFRYDEVGNEVFVKDPKGQTIQSTYDALDRCTSKTYAFAPGDPARPWKHTVKVEFEYDPNGNVTKVTQYQERNGSPAETSHHQLLRRPGPTGSRDDHTTGHGHDANRQLLVLRRTEHGRRSRIRPGPSPFTPMTDRTASRQSPPSTAPRVRRRRRTRTFRTVSSRASFSRTESGALGPTTRLTASSTITYTKGPTVLSRYEYRYDDNGNRTRQIETIGGSTETTTYTYDDLDRLITITYPADAAFPNGRLVKYEYDNVGNRTRELTTDPLTTLVLSDKTGVFGATNWLLELHDNLDPARSVTFAYDANGNQTSTSRNGLTTRFVYDVESRQTNVEQGESVLGVYQYDADGRLIEASTT